ncbi:ionotropic receptor 93a-like [Eriocheir sinensis]|uniref:ionotropic receptor 93a-like n=1 Tax=Eriocheir sinensis TaxID=95602 RepID=UPI0021C5984E|nr:ionotropic receptor 93a-like [Eriocheir sinensis]
MRVVMLVVMLVVMGCVNSSPLSAFVVKGLFPVNSKDSEEASLTRFLTAALQEMGTCDLSLAVGERAAQRWPGLIYSLLLMVPLPRQVLTISAWQDFAGISRTSSTCQGNVIILQDPETLLTFVSNSPTDWDYDGRFVVVGLNKTHLEALTRSRCGRKTKHIVGLVQSERRPGVWEVFVNQLYSHLGTAQVTTWTGTRFTLPRPLFPEKLENFNGANLKVVVVEYNPAIFYLRDGRGSIVDRYGLDIEVIEAMARLFNFTPRYIESPPGELWGELLPNGSFSGMVGMIGREEGDVAVGNVYLSSFLGRLNYLSYSASYATDWSCFQARVEPPLPYYLALALPYRLTTWLSLLGCTLMLVPVLHLLATPEERQKQNWTSISDSLLHILGLHFRIPQTRVPAGTTPRVLVAFLWLYVIIITTGYSSNLTAFLTVQRSPAGVETIKELYESKMTVLGLGQYFKFNMMQSANPYVQGLAGTYKLLFNVEEMDSLIERGEGVGIQGKKYQLYIIKKRYSPRGTPTVRILKECFMSHSIALALQVHSPLKPLFDRGVSRVVESGLVNRWFAVSISRASQEDEGDEDDEDEEGKREGFLALSLAHIQGVFFILFFGSLAALLLFCLELVFGRK